MSLLAPQTIRGLAAAYALLALTFIASILGAIAFATMPPLKHDVKVVKQSLGDQNLTRLATAYIKQIAGAQGFTVRKVEVTKVVPSGDSAAVTAKVTVVDSSGLPQTVKLVVSFRRGVWSPTGAAAA